ncbi:hypothetical protein [Roseibium sediminicola]|uniref:Uncharacterized protein n=1 Tax=Roseibium sediminicola TaxID=2933272 RepID=A0ABT0GZD5_9HYPH|nr:hypothetical protein [Roseibium sp. CAU 1639]MCK7614793.1 hypothetical protein [Roseibium sp. CAU 1639]
MPGFIRLKKTLLVLVSLLCFSSPAIGAAIKNVSIRPMSASSHIEEEQVQSFMKSVVQVYLLYGEYSTELDGFPNLLFLSGSGFLLDGAINLEKVQEFLPGMTQEDADFFRGDSDSCLVVSLPLKEFDVVLGVNDTSNSSQDMNFRCVLDAVSFFLDADSHQSIDGDSVRAYFRNLIDALKARYSEKK